MVIEDLISTGKSSIGAIKALKINSQKRRKKEDKENQKRRTKEDREYQKRKRKENKVNQNLQRRAGNSNC